jgi:hypothetical protein
MVDRTLAVLGLRGWALQHLIRTADLTRARAWGEATAVDCKRVLGPDHPDTLLSRSHLDFAYQWSGDLGRAIPLLQATLADCERVLGPDHPHTQLVRSNAQAAAASHST